MRSTGPMCVLALCGLAWFLSFDARAQAPTPNPSPAAPQTPTANEGPRDTPRFDAVSIKRNTSTSGSLSTRSLPNVATSW